MADLITPEIHRALMRALRSSTKFIGYIPKAIATGSREGHDSEAWRGAKQARAAIAQRIPTSPPIGTDEELIERLKRASRFSDNAGAIAAIDEAADALVSRISEVERLREALQRCAWLAEMESGQLAIDVADAARAALSQHRTTG